ncbi:MAG TPA: protein kinase, partial [Kofleriaceae bacterium]|nr:protein kinase [Kofleriaceae bacterium]
MIGTVIANKYRCDAELGAGSMGVVYRARQLDLGRDVAIKLLHQGAATRPKARLRFVREAKVATRLVHPAAVQILDFGEPDHQPYMVMAPLVPESLRDRPHPG